MLSFDERRILKERISEIQKPKEKNARHMWVLDASGKRVYLGGNSRPIMEQNKWGYPEGRQSAYTVETDFRLRKG